VRTIRDYFNRRYDQYTAFADHEYKYFQQLPGNLRMELARQLKYLDHHTDTSKPGLLCRVPSLRGLDSLSIILICCRLKTRHYMPSTTSDVGGREYIFRRHDVGHDMMIVADGTVHAIETSEDQASDTDVIVLKFGDYIDEHMALLPAAGYLRRQSAYAVTEVTVALLSSDDLTNLRKERANIDKHVRPFVTYAKRVRYINNIDTVFAAMDTDGDGWITLDEFRTCVNNRKRREEGGNEAEAFFHTVMIGQPVTDELIEETYRDIFLHDVSQRQEDEAYQTLAQQGHTNVSVDKQQFLLWWISDQTHDMDEDLEKKRIQTKLARVHKVLQQTAQKLEVCERLVQES